jgi:TolA-binding protein
MKKLLSLLLLMSLVSPALPAEDKSESGLGFWEMLRMKIEQFTPQKKLNTTTAVGGVRGAPVQANDIYWKGETKPQTIDTDELAEFQKAMALVEADQKDQARAAFSDFSAAHPTSPLRPDAEKALAQLQRPPAK